MLNAPKANEVEVSLFGPGFGECILVHIGDGRWIVVDSCVKADGSPVAISYLNEMGGNADCVELIVATHWHDDHIRGISAVVSSFPNSKLCVSGVMTNNELVQAILANDSRPMTNVSSGVREMRRVLELRRGGDKSIIRGIADRRILHIPGKCFSHGHEVNVWTLSPSDAAMRRFLDSLGRLSPKSGEQKQRVPSIDPNESSVVVWVEVGPISLLLGADLEESGGCRGWTQILSSDGRPTTKAGFFKVPHHGSSNAHHDEVWKSMLIDAPLFAVAPYDRGRKLPARDDVMRLSRLSPNGYLTAPSARRADRRKGTLAGKIIKDFGIELEVVGSATGQVRARAVLGTDDRFPDPQLLGDAMRIGESLR